MRRVPLVVLPILVGLLAACLPCASWAAAAGPAPGTLIDEPCDIETADDAIAARLRCARLHVLRDPERPDEGTFELAVVVKRSAEPKPGAMPVLFLHGGPGGSITPYLGRSPRDIAPGHDLVAFDMRGGGRSTPRVCDGAFGRLGGAFLHADGPGVAAEMRAGIVAECLASWRAAGFKPEHFGTERNVADADALRIALTVDRWLLLGESYGTTVAAHYLATRPERIAAAVLDSLYPDDAHVLPTAEMQGRLADRLARECRDEPACAARWPDFGRAQLDAAVAALDADPLRVGRGADARLLDGMGLRRLMMAIGSFEAGVRSLPLLVDAAARRDAALLAGPVAMSADAGDDSANLAATFATDCRDRARHHQATDSSDPMSLLSGLPGIICRDWATPGQAPRWPVGSVPILILAGGYDAFQPDAAAIAAPIGPQARVVEFAFAAHGVRGAGDCPRALVSTFLAAPQTPLETACIAKMQSPAFLDGVVPLRGPAQLASIMISGQPPPAGLLVAALAALAAVVTALTATVRRRRAKTALPAMGWLWAAAGAALTGVLAVAAAVLSTDPLASAALLYGLPIAWSWLPWFLLVPAVVGGIALWRGRTAWSVRVAGGAAIIVTLTLGLAGWLPL
jgi:pimeloyl-ACP methyl ester carboxylesterase